MPHATDQLTETGVTAIGAAVRDMSGQTAAAISVAMPTVRLGVRSHLQHLVGG
ncbi:IclR family transcriptional regulator C-terminal domain-containing protein [Nonomuraea sp. NPDC050536]|uniref:IclR family transcriptional regulator domain-containing protein n=1 Tax=Nonomuraea sp. NPDC050536 TaxID=3364366 RepID=UPI0037CBEDEF